MAKKKANPQSENKRLETQEQTLHHHNQKMDDSASEKLDSLKSLNAMLLKETVERRQQVDSLIQSKGVLESELSRCKIDKGLLQSELNGLIERAVMLEIEKGLVSDFVAVQVGQLVEANGKQRDVFWMERVEMEERIGSLERDMGRVLKEKKEIEQAKREMESEIGSLSSRLEMLVDEIGKEKLVSSSVCKERDDIRAQLNARILEEEGMRLKVIEAEKREAGIQEELRKLRSEYNRLAEEKRVSEERIESLLKEKDSIQRSLVESSGLVDELRTNIEVIVKEKAAIEEEKDMEDQKKEKLQESIGGLKELISNLEKNEKVLLEKVANVEKRCVESSEKEVEMQKEIDELMGDKKDKEGNIQKLIEEKSLVTKDLEEALKMLDDQKFTIENLVQEKSDIEYAKLEGEKDIVKLKDQLGEYKDTMLSLEKSNMGQIEKLKQLETEVNQFKAAFDEAIAERNKARENLDEEKMNGNNLKEKLLKMEKDMEEVREELVKMTSVNSKLVGDNNELESRCAVLTKDMAFVENKLSKTQKEFDDLKAKLGLAEANSKLVLKILKNTSLICQSKEDGIMVIDQENGFGEEMNQHVMELEAIKRAFKERESAVQDMKRQLEFLENTVAEVHKKKGFWTLVSSATTLVAAASLAYVARVH